MKGATPPTQDIGLSDNSMIVITTKIDDQIYTCSAGMGIPDEVIATWRRNLQACIMVDRNGGIKKAQRFTPEWPIQIHLVKQTNKKEIPGKPNDLIVTAKSGDDAPCPQSPKIE
jgi:hypothetical protein